MSYENLHQFLVLHLRLTLGAEPAEVRWAGHCPQTCCQLFTFASSFPPHPLHGIHGGRNTIFRYRWGQMNLRAESISLSIGTRVELDKNSVAHRLGAVSGREAQPIDIFSRGNGGAFGREVTFRWFSSLSGTCDPWLSIR